MGKIVGNYIFNEKYTCTSTTTKTFVGPEAGRGKIVEITFASIIDYTTANNKLILGFRDAQSTDHYFKVDKQSNTYQTVLEGKIYLLPGEKPIGVVESPGKTDVLYCTFHGVIYELES